MSDRNVPYLRFSEFTDNWENKKIEDILQVKHGKSQKTVEDDFGEYPILATGGTIGQANQFLHDRESVLIGRKGTIDRPIYINEPFWTIDTLFYTEIDLKNYNAYWIYNSFLKINWYQHNEASGVPSLSAKNIESIKITTPSKKEQDKIANFFKILDKNIKAKEKEIKKMNELKKAYMQQIFNQEIRFKDENSKFYPSWEKKRIGEIADSFSGGTPSSSKKEYYSGTIPFIRSGEIKKRKTKLYISEQALENSSAKMVEVGDLLIALYGATSGQVSISKINGAINQAILCLRTTEDNLFIMYQWDFYKDQIINKYIQGGQGNLSGSLVKDVFLNFPIIEEQKKIGKFLSLIDQKIELKNQELEKIKKYKKAFLQKMFI